MTYDIHVNVLLFILLSYSYPFFTITIEIIATGFLLLVSTSLLLLQSDTALLHLVGVSRCVMWVVSCIVLI